MATLRTLVVIFILLSSIFLVMCSNNLIEDAGGYVTPDSGVSWNMATLATNSGGDVTNLGGGLFLISNNITISLSDTLTVGSGETLQIGTGFHIFVEGALFVSASSLFPAVFTNVPFQAQWGGIHFNPTGTGTIDNAIITNADSGLSINGSSPWILNTLIKGSGYGVRVDQGGTPVFNNTEIRNNIYDGVKVLNNSRLSMGSTCHIMYNGANGITVENSSIYIDISNIFYNNASGIHIANSTGNVIKRCNFTGNSQIVGSTAALFADNSMGDLTDNDFYNNNQFGIFLSWGSSFNITNTAIIKTNLEALHLASSSVELLGLRASHNGGGIYVGSNSNGSYTDVILENSTGTFGVMIVGSPNNFFNNLTIVKNPITSTKAIHISLSSSVNLTDVYVGRPFKYGLLITDSSYINVTNATVYDSSGSGGDILNSDNITLSRFVSRQNSKNGLVINDSRNIDLINGSRIYDNLEYGLSLNNATLDFINGSCFDNSLDDLIIEVDSIAYLLNTSLPSGRVFFPGAGGGDISTIYRWWYLNINVTTESLIWLAPADVTVLNSTGVKKYEKETGPIDTQYFGKEFWLRVFESEQNSTGTFSDNEYTIWANMSGRKSNSTTLNVDRHIEITMILWPNLPPGNITNLQPQVIHDNTPQMTWNASADPEGDQVFYRLVINDTVSDVVNIVTTDLFYNVTTVLKFGFVYNITIFPFDEWLWEGNYTYSTLELINNKPSKPSITLENPNPHTDHTLMLNISVPSSDPDYHPTNFPDELVRYTVQWYKNGVPQPGLERNNKTLLEINHSTISPGLTTINDNWMVKVTPYDGHNTSWQLDGSSGAHDNGTTVSAQVTVLDRAPYYSTVLNDFAMDEDPAVPPTVDLAKTFRDLDIMNDTDSLAFTSSGWSQIVVGITGGLATFTPAQNWNGFEDIKLRGTDSYTKFLEETVRVTVNPINDPPVIDPIPDLVAYEDSSFIFYLHGNDTADGDTLDYSTNITDEIAGLVLNTNYFVVDDTTYGGKKITIIPDNTMIGNYTIRYTLDDQQSAANSVVTDDFKLQIVNTNDPPATPLISTPPDDSTFIEDVDITFTGSSTDPDEPWGDILTYTWSSSLDDQMGTGTSVIKSDLSIGTHTITLTVTDGVESALSTITVTIEQMVEVVTAEASLISPQNESTINTLWVILKWESSHAKAAEFTYDVYLSEKSVPSLDNTTEGGGNTGLLTINISKQGNGLDLEDGKTYFWMVIPKYKGLEGNPSEIYHFNVNLFYERPTPTAQLVGPEHEATSTSTSVELNWASTHENAADFTYDLYWSKSVLDYDALPDPPSMNVAHDVLKHQLSGLEETTWYWTVVPVDNDGKRGTVTNTPKVWSFKVDTGGGDIDITAKLLKPANGSTVNNLTVKLKWNSDDANTVGYKYKVFISETKAQVLDNLKFTLTILETDFTATDGKTYYWTVIPNTPGGDGISTSGIWSFKVDLGFVEEHKLNVTGGQDVSIDAGGSKTVKITVKNTGNVDETLTVSLEAGGLSGATVSPTSVTIGPDGTETVDVTITIPENAGDGTYTLTVKFTPEGETEPLSEIDFQVTVIKKPETDGDDDGDDVEGSNVMALGIGIVVIIIVVLVVLFLLMKRKKEGGEGEGGEEGEERTEDAEPAVQDEPPAVQQPGEGEAGPDEMPDQAAPGDAEEPDAGEMPAEEPGPDQGPTP